MPYRVRATNDNRRSNPNKTHGLSPTATAKWDVDFSIAIPKSTVMQRRRLGSKIRRVRTYRLNEPKRPNTTWSEQWTLTFLSMGTVRVRKNGCSASLFTRRFSFQRLITHVSEAQAAKSTNGHRSTSPSSAAMSRCTPEGTGNHNQ